MSDILRPVFCLACSAMLLHASWHHPMNRGLVTPLANNSAHDENRLFGYAANVATGCILCDADVWWGLCLNFVQNQATWHLRVGLWGDVGVFTFVREYNCHETIAKKHFTSIIHCFVVANAATSLHSLSSLINNHCSLEMGRRGQPATESFSFYKWEKWFMYQPSKWDLLQHWMNYSLAHATPFHQVSGKWGL